jgi:hypothetical protein
MRFTQMKNSISFVAFFLNKLVTEVKFVSNQEFSNEKQISVLDHYFVKKLVTKIWFILNSEF